MAKKFPKNDINTQILETLPQIQETTISKINTKKAIARRVKIKLMKIERHKGENLST